MKAKNVAVMVVVACLTPLCIVSGFAFGQDVSEANKKSEITYDVIKKAWLARQKTYSAAKLSLVQDVKRLKLMAAQGPHPELNKIDPAMAEKLANAYDEYQEKIQISIAGSRIHYCRNGMMPGEKGLLYSGKTQAACDGRTVMCFSDKNDEIPYPRGSIGQNPQCDAEFMIDFEPIVWTFGNLDRTLLAQLGNTDITVTDAILDSRLCIVLKTNGTGLWSGQANSYWLDPSKNYVVVRHTSACGKLGAQLDCSYVQSGEGCWVPTEWTITAKYGNGGHHMDTPSYIVHAKVQESVVNPTFAQDEFTIKFPPGTIVSDVRPQARLSSGGEGYFFLVEKNGRQRMIAPKEVRALEKEADWWMRFRWGWILCCCILIGLLTCVFLLRQRFRLKNA
jgi:hypothetical protein